MQERDTINELASIAASLNGLAKQLNEPAQRQAAYRLKATVSGIAILLGGAVVDGKRADDIVGLSFLCDPPTQIHVRVSHLQPAARAEVRRQSPSVLAKAPLADGLDSDQVKMLQNLVARQGGRR